VVIDLNKITIAEYRSLFDKNQTQDEEDQIIAKAAGLTVEELRALTYIEYRRLTAAFFDTAKNPLADPN
jgi:hypothetical protein